MEHLAQLPSLVIPKPSRPVMPKDYGIPQDNAGMLSWDFVRGLLKEARLYWLTTISPESTPHTTPNWAAFVDDYVLFGTSPETRKAKNLARNPAITIAVHQESASGSTMGDPKMPPVVFMEGHVALTTDKDLLTRLDDEYERKYGNRDGWQEASVVIPHKIFAYADFPDTPTRWMFTVS